MSEITVDSSTTEEKIHKPNCKRNVSGELDVFEATRYFSDFSEPTTIECSRVQIQKQNIVTENRQKKVHPETTEQIPKPRKKKMTRGNGGKLNCFLNALLRSAGLKKSKSTPEVETPRGDRRRRKSYVVTTHVEATSPISGAGAWSINSRRRSFDERLHVRDSKKNDEKLDIRRCKSLCADKRVECTDRNRRDDDDDVNGIWESDSSSESDLFELDLLAKSKP